MKPLYFFVGIVIISCVMVGLLDQIGESNFLSIFGVIGSLVGGLLGALAAYWIAQEQNKHQETSKVTDLKIQKFEAIILYLKNIKTEIKDLELMLYLNSDSQENIENLTFIYPQYKEGKKKEIEKNLSKIEEIKVYFNLMDWNPDAAINHIRWVSTGYPIIENPDFSKKDMYNTIVYHLKNNRKEIENIIRGTEREIEKILLKNH